MRGTLVAIALFVGGTPAARAEGPPQLYVEPRLGVDPLGFGLTGFGLPPTSFGASLGMGARFKKFDVGGQVGTAHWFAFEPGFNSQNDLRFGANFDLRPKELHENLDLLLVENVNLGPTFISYDSGTSSGLDTYFRFGLSSGAGVEWRPCNDVAVDAAAHVDLNFLPESSGLSTTLGFGLDLGVKLFPKGGLCDGGYTVADEETPTTGGGTCSEGSSDPSCNPIPTCSSDEDEGLCLPADMIALIQEEFGHSTPTPDPSSQPEPCTYWVTDGWFEPTQGNYQDDNIFKDKVAQLIRTNPPGGVPSYYGTLNMVKGRDTVFTGVEWYKQNGGIVEIKSRDDIVIRGRTTCSQSKPVKLQFTLFEAGGGARVVHVNDRVFSVPILGPPLPENEEVDFHVNVGAGYGLPEEGSTFTFNQAGHYQIKAELIGVDGGPTGLAVWHAGYTQETPPPKMTFFALQTSPDTSPREENTSLLLSQARNIGEQARRYVPDWYPVPRGGIIVAHRELQRIYPDEHNALMSALIAVKDFFTITQEWDKLAAKIIDQLSTSTIFEGGGRSFAILSNADFDALAGQDTSAVNPSTKVILLREGAEYSTVAHEFVHSTPTHIWSNNQMATECGRVYHNEFDHVATGLRILTGGVDDRDKNEVPYAAIPLMGPRFEGQYKHPAQCTYWHLLSALKTLADPPVIFVRAALARKGGQIKGVLGPLYTMDGVPDLFPTGKGSWAIVLRDAGGKELARYPFEPEWEIADAERQRDLLPIAVQVLPVAGAAKLELVGPGGVQDTRVFSASAPVVTLGAMRRTSPDTVRIEWTGQAADDHPLLYHVLVSADGVDWSTQVFDGIEATAELRAKPGAKVRILATDGSRSSDVQGTLP